MTAWSFSPAQWAVAALAALCVGMAKSGLSGLGMVAVVLMALIMPARESTGALLTVLIVADIYAVIAFRRHAQWGHVFALLPPAAFRTPRSSSGPKRALGGDIRGFFGGGARSSSAR